jgi:cytochrome P450
MKPLSSFDFFDPKVAEDPYEFYAALRREAPVYPVPGLGFYLVTRYDDVVAVLKQPELFSNRFAQAMQGRTGGPRTELLEIWKQGWMPVDTLLTNDPPSHTRFRSLVNKAFSARRVAGMDPQIRGIANDLVDAFASAGQVELVRQFAVPLPLTVIADQLGVPREDMPRFKKWSDDAVAPLGQMISPERELECARSVVESQHYFAARLEERKAKPREDVLTDLVTARVEGERPLDTAESLSILQQVLVAGNETTTHLIAAAMLLLLRHPDQLERVRRDPSLVPNLVEEVLRLESPVQGMWRVATQATEIAGVSVPAGAFLMLRYAAANRDETRFPDPDRFDVGRENARTHLAFGLGIHFCIGAALARKEGAVAFETLLSRLGSIRLAEGKNDFAHAPSILLRGLTALHLEVEPA